MKKVQGCCDRFQSGVVWHLSGPSGWAQAKNDYSDLGGCNFAADAKSLTSWIDAELPVIFLKGFSTGVMPLLSSADELARFENFLLSSVKTADFQPWRRTITLLWYLTHFAPTASKPAWHRLKAISDLLNFKQKEPDLVQRISRLGITYNPLDEQGIPIPGFIRGRLPSDPDGWHNVNEFKFIDGILNTVGVKATELPPFITQDDIDVALYLAFVENVALVFSLDGVDKGHPSKLNRKRFQPDWLASTDFGQAFYFADWLMKSMSASGGHGVPSLTNPFVSSSTVNDWRQPAFLKHLSSLQSSMWHDDYALPDGTRAESGRLQIVGEGVQLSRARYKNRLGQDVFQYQIKKINTYIDSSLYRDKGSSGEAHFKRRDKRTKVGKFAAELTKHYDYASDLFPIFRRVEKLLAIFNTFYQARQDGVRLSPSEISRITALISKFRYNKVNYLPTVEYSPRTYHSDGCLCQGGVGAEGKNNLSAFQVGEMPGVSYEVNFVIASSGFITPVPKGAKGPSLVPSGNGFRFLGGSGGHGFSKSTAQVWIMDETIKQGTRTYYKNITDQKIDPFTGRTIDEKHPMAHIYHEKDKL
jgi:hypothetical protein